ncbi:MAG: CDP-diacylglycerol--glycerol-3-phosphate 3-phosphatidyltransferase [Alphaproteobacteria bacterium]|nr:CDP-diacylglycerol--glycerol-3-phosphate 3-phosphatidyltransferase [Alphaproteobacteria bacterium]
MQNLPNILTFFRIAILPIIIGLFFIPDAWAAWTALGLYTVASITDFLDGYLARSMKTESALGKFLDPISDKIFIAALLLALVDFDRLDGIWVIPATIILVREFLVAGLREFLAPQNIQLPVSKLAKWKTTVQMIALGFLVVGNHGDVVLPHTLTYGQWGIAIAAALTVITGWSYLKAGLKHI